MHGAVTEEPKVQASELLYNLRKSVSRPVGRVVRRREREFVRSVIAQHTEARKITYQVSEHRASLKYQHSGEGLGVSGRVRKPPREPIGILNHHTTVPRSPTTKPQPNPNLAIQLEPTARGFLVVTLRLSIKTIRVILHQGNT